MNIIYNFDDLKLLLSDKSNEGAYYLLYDEDYFEEIEKGTVINREVYTIAKRIMKPLNIIKYITFNVKDTYTTKQIYDLVKILRKNTVIIATIFNPKTKEVCLLFISNKDDSLLEYHIKIFLELEDI